MSNNDDAAINEVYYMDMSMYRTGNDYGGFVNDVASVTPALHNVRVTTMDIVDIVDICTTRGHKRRFHMCVDTTQHKDHTSRAKKCRT